MWSDIKVDGAGNVSRFMELDPPQDKNNTTLIDTFIGTKHVRYGPRPSLPNVEYMKSQLNRCVDEERPVNILTMWGGSKGYNQTDMRSADFLDVMALKRFACLQQNVKAIHRPGIRIQIVMEDFTGTTLRGPQGSLYHYSLNELKNCLGLDFITITKESSLITHDDYGKQVHINADALLNNRPETVGWVGDIAWDHYLARVNNQFPQLSDADKRHKVGLYLGCTLARHQFKTIPSHDLKISFVPYPESVPDSFRKGRIEYKVKPNKHSQKTAAPWTCFGVVNTNNDCWTHASVRDVRNKHFSVNTLRINNIEVPTLHERTEICD